MIQRSWFAALALVASAAGASCSGGSGPGQTRPAASSKETVTSFMRAVADSDLTKMAHLWGTPKGAAATTGQPADYERRIVVIQSYLRSDDYRIASDVAETPDQRGVQVELRRQACTWMVPFTVNKLNDGTWLVTNINLTRAGNPARPCNPEAQADSTGKP